MLTDPRSGSIRYVGKTVSLLKERLQVHLATAGYYPRRHVCHWIRQLKNAGMCPEIQLLEEVQPGEDWQERERYWIARMRSEGHPLTNHTDGGEGCHGLAKSEETRAKTGAKHRGKTITTAQRLKQSLAMRGRKLTDEHKRKVALTSTGRRHTAEVRRKISEALKGRPPIYGEKNGRAKVTDSQVMEIINSPLSLRRIAAIYGIGKSQASRIRSGRQRVALGMTRARRSP